MWTFANRMMLVITVIICVVQMIVWYPHLPDPIPSHFDAQGQVDGEMGKTPYFLLIGGVELLFLIGIPLLAMGLKFIPDELINIPNKEYWLAPERRDATIGTSLQFLQAIGWMSGWLMIGIFHLTSEVAIGLRGSINPEFYWIMGLYLAAVFGGTVWLMLKFRMPARPEAVVPLP